MKFVLTRCPTCRRKGIAPAKVDRTYRAGGVDRAVRSIPAQVCPHCGAAFFDLAAGAYVDRVLGVRRGQGRPRAA